MGEPGKEGRVKDQGVQRGRLRMFQIQKALFERQFQVGLLKVLVSFSGFVTEESAADNLVESAERKSKKLSEARFEHRRQRRRSCREPAEGG